MEQEKIPIQFIRCMGEDIQKMKLNFDINLNLEKEPEENPIENFIKELEKISI